MHKVTDNLVSMCTLALRYECVCVCVCVPCACACVRASERTSECMGLRLLTCNKISTLVEENNMTVG